MEGLERKDKFDDKKYDYILWMLMKQYSNIKYLEINSSTVLLTFTEEYF